MRQEDTITKEEMGGSGIDWEFGTEHEHCYIERLNNQQRPTVKKINNFLSLKIRIITESTAKTETFENPAVAPLYLVLETLPKQTICYFEMGHS